MSHQESNTQANNTQIIKRNRLFGVLIILIVAAPMLVAYVMFQTGWGVSAHTTNKGELINPPLPMTELVLANDSLSVNTLFEPSSGSKKWRLLIPVDEQCGDICQQNLYTTRQVHIRLAEKAYRVERMIISLSGALSAPLEQQLAKEHPNTRRISTSPKNFTQWLSSANIQADAAHHYYLIDQEGFAMMRYNTSHTGQDLLDDIKRLLKFTYDK